MDRQGMLKKKFFLSFMHDEDEVCEEEEIVNKEDVSEVCPIQFH
jgi:hypothetical protein